MPSLDGKSEIGYWTCSLPQAREKCHLWTLFVILAGDTFPEICEGGESQKSLFLIWRGMGVRGRKGYFQGCWRGLDNDVQARRQPQKFPSCMVPTDSLEHAHGGNTVV